MTNIQFSHLALSFPGAIEKPHFDRKAYKIDGGRTFTTLHEILHQVNVFLPKEDQAVFITYENGAIYPVANKWGDQGWTTFELDQLQEEVLQSALETAYAYALSALKKKK